MHSRKVSGSRYRQVRLTLTEQSGGRVTYSIYAKGLNQAWDEHQVIVRDSIVVEHPMRSTEDVIHVLLGVLREQLLPGHID